MATKAKRAKRATVACADCGLELTSNNLARHRRAAHGVEPEPSTNGAKPGKGSSAYGASKAVGAYLAQLDEQSDERRNGRRRHRGANLGRMAGFPNFTDDPDVIEAAADALAERARDVPSYVGALRQQQRIIELRQLADDLRNGSGADAVEAAFVEVAAAWATANGISYAAFRVMGVPASVLREAGIT